MNVLLIAFIAYTLVFGWLWHNKSSRDSDPEPLKTTREQAKSDKQPADSSKESLAAHAIHAWLKG
jgi:hypothetical protein